MILLKVTLPDRTVCINRIGVIMFGLLLISMAMADTRQTTIDRFMTLQGEAIATAMASGTGIIGISRGRLTEKAAYANARLVARLVIMIRIRWLT